MPLTQVLFISLIIFLSAYFLFKKNRFVLSFLEKCLVFTVPIVLTPTSLFIYAIKYGGTIKYTSHGWPHFFYLHQIEDVIDKTFIDKWHFVPGSLFSYPISDYIFYFSVTFLFIVIIKIIKNKFI